MAYKIGLENIKKLSNPFLCLNKNNSIQAKTQSFSNFKEENTWILQV
ncbi:hypothetical protein [Hathewaya massiliensis]|nr:hypothetical protein [Hathewaya massiliensis]